MALPWEGTYRPQRFAGVATVVCKLFNILPANVVFFGQKDYQQAVAIQQLIADLEIPLAPAQRGSSLASQDSGGPNEKALAPTRVPSSRLHFREP